MLQPGASLRPVITKRSCTPPSGVPSGLLTKRASRTGPVAVTKGGNVFIAPCAVATWTCGLAAGLDPPTDGCAWQPAQLLRLNPGPNPVGTVSTSLNTFFAALKKLSSFWLRPGRGPSAPGDPPRTPGSTTCAELLLDEVTLGLVCPRADSDTTATPNITPAMPRDNPRAACRFVMSTSPTGVCEAERQQTACSRLLFVPNCTKGRDERGAARRI
jgi:hypothetical protein